MRRMIIGWVAVAALASALAAAGQKFYRDDPLWRDPETQDASAARPIDVSEQYDFL
jgi:hypothetical protein